MPIKHPKVNIKLTHKLNSFPVEAPSTATFGDLKVGCCIISSDHQCFSIG